MPDQPSEKISAMVPRETIEAIAHLAREHDRPLSSEIRQALKGHVERQQADAFQGTRADGGRAEHAGAAPRLESEEN